MTNKIKVLFFILVGVIFFTLADGLTAEAAATVNGYELPTYYADSDMHITWNYSENGNERFWCLIIPANANISAYIASDGWLTVESDVALCYGYIASEGYYATDDWVLTPLTSGFRGNFTEIVSSDYDIYDAGGNLFFRAPSPLVRVAAGIRVKKVMREILTMIPLLIPLLVGYLGFRKALRWLLMILRTA